MCALCGFLFGCFVPASVDAQDNKPFILPAAEPASPSTWLLGQPYGNTVGAYLRGADWYEAGQRLHFGIDLSMPCGTPLVAIGDGEVAFVDDRGFGSGPHNLLIRHPEPGLISLYGHLLERPLLVPGQWVEQGQVVAYSGDPDETCDSRPHLHLEIRSLDYFTAYNPVDYIQADWHTLSLIGQFSAPTFQQDLDNARQWMSIDDQPPVAFGGRALNAYAATYPAWDQGSPPANPPMLRATAPVPAAAPEARRLAFDNCCANPRWHPTEPGRLFLIDGAPEQRAGIFEWDTVSGELVNLIGQAPPPHTSPDGTHTLALSGGQTVITQTLTGESWSVETGGALAALSADNSQLLWIVQGLVSLPGGEEPQNQVWISGARGENARMIAAEAGLSAQWLDSARVMLSRRVILTTTIGVYDAAADQAFVLGAWERVRALTVAPGGGRLMFYLAYQADAAQDGVYVIETQPNAQAEKLTWFGAWRWRDADSAYYIPFEPESPQQRIHLYHLNTGEDRRLIDNLMIADGDWSVSADGRQIAYRNLADRTVWVLTF
ncbi:MAG: M23 family metallopeptidase [bacterium]|nr:M23 family metallopeptidase [bacterium]